MILFGLVLILIAAVAWMSYREGFIGTPPARVTVTKICRNAPTSSVQIYAKTTDQSTLLANIVYRAEPTATTADRVLQSNVVISAADDKPIATIVSSNMPANVTFYIVDKAIVHFDPLSATPYGSFTYDKNTVEMCTTTLSDPSKKPMPTFIAASAAEEDSPSVSVSDATFAAMSLKQRSDLLRDIQKTVRNELLSTRQLDQPSTDGTSMPSIGTEQGKEYSYREKRRRNNGLDFEGNGGWTENVGDGTGPASTCNEGNVDGDDVRCPPYPNGGCPPVPDMSQYIRKDAIPCYGCAVDY